MIPQPLPLRVRTTLALLAMLVALTIPTAARGGQTGGGLDTAAISQAPGRTGQLIEGAR